MKFSAALIAAAVGVSANGYGGYGNGTEVIVTETVSSIVTYCPGPTEITHGSQTYTVTEPTTLTITDCPCTITRPVTTSSVEACTTCGGGPGYNTTVAPPPPPPTGGVTPTSPPGPGVTAGAGKAAALSGAGLAGVVGLAAFIL